MLALSMQSASDGGLGPANSGVCPLPCSRALSTRSSESNKLVRNKLTMKDTTMQYLEAAWPSTECITHAGRAAPSHIAQTNQNYQTN